MSDVTQTMERNKEVVNRILFDGFVGGDLSLWDELVSPDFVDKTAAPGAPNDRSAWAAGLRCSWRHSPTVGWRFFTRSPRAI